MTLFRRSSLINTIPFLVLVVAQLHLLRNISSIYSIFVLLSFSLSVWFTFYKWRLFSRNEKLVLYAILAVFTIPILPIGPSAIFGIYSDFGDIGIGIARLMFSLPIYLVVLASSPKKENIQKLLLLASIISLVASLSIPYQFVFGPISWFADNSERAGFLRYASMFGSLTALGIVCGYAILASIISIKSNHFKAFVIVGMIVGAILSLQKAALINAFIGIAIWPFIQKLRLKAVAFPFVLFLCISYAFIFYFSDELSGYLSSVRLFSDSNSSYSDDVSISESLVERLVDNPTVALNYHGLDKLFFGIGPIGGSGSFGYPDIPMSHNGIVDIFLIAGIPYFLMFLILFTLITRIALSNTPQVDMRQIKVFGWFVFLGQIVNMVFSGLILFSPSNAMFFSIAIKCLISNGHSQDDA